MQAPVFWTSKTQHYTRAPGDKGEVTHDVCRAVGGVPNGRSSFPLYCNGFPHACFLYISMNILMP